MIGNLSAMDKMHDDPPMNPQYYQFMVFRMTEDLNLTPDQAEKFFPLLRPYQNSKHDLHEKMAQLSDEVFNNNKIDKDDLERYKDIIKNIHLDEMKLDQDFYNEIEGFLTPEQVAKFIFFDQRFRMQLSHELKQRYGDGRPEQKHNKHFWKK